MSPAHFVSVLHAKGHHYNDLPLLIIALRIASVTVYWYGYYCSSVPLAPFTAQYTSLLCKLMVVRCLLQPYYEIVMSIDN